MHISAPREFGERLIKSRQHFAAQSRNSGSVLQRDQRYALRNRGANELSRFRHSFV
jgi:hypothetical protein